MGGEEVSGSGGCVAGRKGVLGVISTGDWTIIAGEGSGMKGEGGGSGGTGLSSGGEISGGEETSGKGWLW